MSHCISVYSLQVAKQAYDSTAVCQHIALHQRYAFVALAYTGDAIDAVHRLLLDVSSAEFKGAQPIEADAFKTWQAECTERGKAGLWTSWLPKCVEVFRRLLPIFINGNSDAYYSSIATLQVLSVCSAMRRFAQVHVLRANTHYAEALQPVFAIVNQCWQPDKDRLSVKDNEGNSYDYQNLFFLSSICSQLVSLTNM